MIHSSQIDFFLVFLSPALFPLLPLLVFQGSVFSSSLSSVNCFTTSSHSFQMSASSSLSLGSSTAPQSKSTQDILAFGKSTSRLNILFGLHENKMWWDAWASRRSAKLALSLSWPCWPQFLTLFTSQLSDSLLQCWILATKQNKCICRWWWLRLDSV